MKTRSLLSLLFVPVLACIGCARPQVNLANAIEDATDVVRVDFTATPKLGWGGHLMATRHLQVQAHDMETAYGFRMGSRVIGPFEESRVGWQLQPGDIITPRVYHSEIPAGFVVGSKSTLLRKGPRYARGEAADEFGFGGHLAIVGLRLGFRPVELIDLFSNCFDADMMRDNSRRYRD